MSETRPIPWRRILTLTIGVALTVAALVVAARHIDFARLASANPAWLGALALGVVGNIFATSAVFWVITRSFDATPPVGFGKMTQLIGASALLNYLPLMLPAGQVGRAAYLKVKNQLPLHQSFLIVMIVLGVSALVMVVAGASAALDPATIGLGTPMRWAFGAAGIALIALASGPVSRMTLRRKTWMAWTWAPLRAVDLLVISIRLYIAFQIVGQPVTFAHVVVAASAGMFVSLLPLTPNGLGLREWVVGALTEAMAPTTGGMGLAASVVDRGVEAVVLTVAGAWAMWKLKRESSG